MATAFDRSEALRRLAQEDFDVLVIGGGITGAGCALDATTRGYRTALVEREDFASGTSSKSSKLVHGGLRYLRQHEIGLVYEALAERQVLLRNAPHLVRPLPFLIPILRRDGLFDRRIARLVGSALWVYDLTGGLRIRRVHRRVTRDAVLAHMPMLRPDRIAAGYLYHDAQADDARLTLAVARTAAHHGAAVANYAPAVGLCKDALGRATGARVQADGLEFDVHARAVVNAAGVWADDVRALDEDRSAAFIRPAKGVHITVPWTRVRNDVAVIVPVPEDGRSIFVVPWDQHTYIGTTDTDYDGDRDHPQCTSADVAYLLRAVNRLLVDPLSVDDVVGTWAGLRPLVADPAGAPTTDLSREHAIRVSVSGVVTVIGGKLTTYRRMAADTIDQVELLLDGRHRRCRTKRLPLVGAGNLRRGRDRWTVTSGHGPPGSGHLPARYGTEAAAVLALAQADPRLAEPIVPGLPYLGAEAVFAVRYEMARTLDDVLTRRTRARLLARDASSDAAPAVARLIAPELGWDDTEIERQVAAYREAVITERAAATAAVTTAV